MRGALKNLPAHVQLLLTWAEQHADKSTQTPNHAEKPHTESAAQPDLKHQKLSSLFLRDNTTYSVHIYSFRKLMRSTNARCTQKVASTYIFYIPETKQQHAEKPAQVARHTENHTQSTAQADLKQQTLSSLLLRDDTTYTVHKYSFGKLMRSTNARYT